MSARIVEASGDRVLHAERDHYERKLQTKAGEVGCRCRSFAHRRLRQRSWSVIDARELSRGGLDRDVPGGGDQDRSRWKSL